MKRIFTLIFCTTVLINAGFAQTDCTGGRYTTYDLFADVDVTTAIVFGNNTSVAGGAVDLKMDVYQPEGDTETARAVVIIAFGGSFIGGSRQNPSVVFLCNVLAKMGYVAVAPDYRVGFFFPNELTTTLAVVRGAHDLKGCVRFLKKTVAEDSNPYGIDCNRIVLGGVSAGGIAAIHAAYLDKESEIPSYMANDIDGIGGVEGNSGTSEYSSAALGVLSFSGTIGDTAWITPGDIPICSIHEEFDDVVPYGTQEISVSGFATGLTASGSRDLHARTNNIGVENYLKTYWGVTDHVGYLNPVDTEAIDFAVEFLADLVCSGATNSCAFVGISEIAKKSISLYPNPATNVLNFGLEENALVEIIDATGRVVISTTSRKGSNRLNVSSLPTGVYTLKSVGNQISTGLFIKE